MVKRRMSTDVTVTRIMVDVMEEGRWEERARRKGGREEAMGDGVGEANGMSDCSCDGKWG